MARTFQHAEMADASKAYSRANTDVGKLPDSLQRCILPESIHPGVATMCSAFVELQYARHTADYDLSLELRRHDALELVQLAESAIASWRSAAAEPSAKAYRISLLLWRKMRKD